MADKRAVSRMNKELERLKRDPPHGVTCWPKEGRLNHLEASLLGGEDTPYKGGIFKLEIKIPHRYPFEPPHVRFLTQIYHPNIDTAGRICMDVLKSPPSGTWKPAHNLHTILSSVQLLLAEPNPDDGLMADIANEYKYHRPSFLAKAKNWTCKHAKSHVVGGTDSLSMGELSGSQGKSSVGDINPGPGVESELKSEVVASSSSGGQTSRHDIKNVMVGADDIEPGESVSRQQGEEEASSLVTGVKRKGYSMEDNGSKPYKYQRSET